MTEKVLNSDLPELEKAGYSPDAGARAGSFLQSDTDIIVSSAGKDGIDVMSIEDAFEKLPEIREKYYGRAFERAGKDYDRDTQGGYFIRIKAGMKSTMPVQACLFLKKKGIKQKVHNIIVVEENAELYLINGCTSSKAADESYHLGISEFFVKKGGLLNFTMIHSWKEDVRVEPKSVALLDESSTFISNYVCLQPVKKISMYPTAILDGEKGRALFNSIILSHPDSFQDIGSRVIFSRSGCSAEIISRAVSLGGTVIARGHLSGNAPGIKAHLECRGLMVSPRGRIHAIPELETCYQDVDMSHEAAIGKVKKEEIEYLASRGIPESEAQSIIIRGFMDVDILGLPDILQKEIARVADRVLSEGL